MRWSCRDDQWRRKFAWRPVTFVNYSNHTVTKVWLGFYWVLGEFPVAQRSVGPPDAAMPTDAKQTGAKAFKGLTVDGFEPLGGGLFWILHLPFAPGDRAKSKLEKARELREALGR